MALAGALLSEESFLCPICLDVFSHPVTTPCGHNFCKNCLQGYWTTSSVCQCPMCKQKFYRRPELKVNTFVSEMASQFQKSVELRSSGSLRDQTPAQTGEVACDVCTGSRVRALSSCLDCLASYCETHLEPHLVLPSFKKHQLISPLLTMADRMCHKHERLLELFCQTDQTYLCQVCARREHRGHCTVTLEEESRLRSVQLGQAEAEVRNMIQGRQQQVRDIRKTVQLSKRNAEREVEESLEVFAALVQCLLRSQADLLKAIQEKKEAAERRAEGLVKDLEQEISELQRRSTELEQLSHTEDHLYLLHNLQRPGAPPRSSKWSGLGVHGVLFVGTVRRAVRRATLQLEEAVRVEVKRLCGIELGRAQECEVDVTLDPDTAHPKLFLSDNGKQVRHGDKTLTLLDGPARFFPGISVLGRQGFSSGRFYFEVQVKGKVEWDVGVGKESVNRKGGNTLSPESGYWTLGLRNGKDYWALTPTPVPLPLIDKPKTVGVYVDWEEGQVSFYDVESCSHIYSFTGYSFAEKLLPYFNPHRNKGGVNSAPLIISPVNHT
ncbi:E3 ubiquitin-protein ligase TRIM21-like [Osmerus mordax]|uniref:E3 ubiquitin-protein ligase TRIM21-like n=1 Tax=Osmerus mordax TaxID=8014 RepID=UPI0035106678